MIRRETLQVRIEERVDRFTIMFHATIEIGGQTYNVANEISGHDIRAIEHRDHWRSVDEILNVICRNQCEAIIRRMRQLQHERAAVAPEPANVRSARAEGIPEELFRSDAPMTATINFIISE